MSLPRFAVRRRVTVGMIATVVVMLGLVSLGRLPVDLMPEINFPALTISVSYPGVGPQEIEELVTRPLERAVSAIPGLERVESTSSEGQSTVRLMLAWGTSIDEAAENVRARVDLMRGSLPDDAASPVIFKFDSTSFPIVFLGVEGNYDLITLREIAENELAPRLERVPGVAAVTVSGGSRREIRVELYREKIAALELPLEQVVAALRAENRNIAAGEIDEGDLTYLLRSLGQFRSLDDIRNLVVVARHGIPIRLRDIADVLDTSEERRSIVRINGKPGVQMTATKQSGENTVAVARGIKAEVERLNQRTDGVKVSVLTDTSGIIERSIASVRQLVLAGSALVALVIFGFLRNIRATLIICTSIPISIIGTLALLYFGGFTLNMLTFGGLALGVGMIVDASIVVLENTYRHMEMGKSAEAAAVDGSEEVWSAIVASTLTQVAVFAPMLLLTGIASIIFGQLAFVVIFSLGMSLFVAVTVVPVLCVKMLRPSPHQTRLAPLGPSSVGRSTALSWLADAYARLLGRALRHRPTVLVSAGALFILALALLPVVGFELSPPTDEAQVQVDVELPVGTRFERAEAVFLRLEQLITAAVPEATTVLVQSGGGGFMGMGGGGLNRGSVIVNLVPKTERERSSDAIAQALRRQLTGVPGAVVRARASGNQFDISRALSGGEGRLSLEVLGHDLDQAALVSAQVQQLLETTPGVADVRLATDSGRPELVLGIDRPKAALFGLSVTDVAQTIQTGVAGTEAALYREAGREHPVVVRLREADRMGLDDVEAVPLSTAAGALVLARGVMTISPGSGPITITRKNEQRLWRVSAEVEDTLGDVVSAVDARLAHLEVPADFTVGFGSDVAQQAETFEQLLLALLLAVVLVYAVMASQYESLRDPFIIMFSIPLAAIGIVGTLLVTGTPLSLQASIGIILLAGLVVNNAILLVDYTNTLRRRDGLALREAVERAGRARLRPILMTTVTTLLGMLPMALGLGEGSELQAPLARVVIGGLATSTLITLVVVPTVYSLLEERLERRRAGGVATEPAAAGTFAAP